MSISVCFFLYRFLGSGFGKSLFLLTMVVWNIFLTGGSGSDLNLWVIYSYFDCYALPDYFCMALGRVFENLDHFFDAELLKSRGSYN